MTVLAGVASDARATVNGLHALDVTHVVWVVVATRAPSSAVTKRRLSNQ